MDIQDPKNTHTPGTEIQGVYLCHKCGWPFPNPHPSARHRRSHKKICGTIEGYKLVDAAETSHKTANSDDEHLSDEDHKTPNPKVLERSNNEKGSGGIGDRSNRSEDEVFADAVAEFSDSGSNMAVEEQLKEIKEPEIHVETTADIDSTTTLLYEGGATNAMNPPPKNLADSEKEPQEVQSAEVPESSLSDSEKESQDNVLSATVGLMARSLAEKGTEDSNYDRSDDNEGSSQDIHPITLETKRDASNANKNGNYGEDLTPIDAQGDETNLVEHSLDAVVPPSDDPGTASEAVSVCGKAEEITSDVAAGGEVVQSSKEHPDELGYKIPSNDESTIAESVEDMNSCFDAAQIESGSLQGIDSTSSGNSFQVYDAKGEGNENVHVLSVHDDIPITDNAESMIKGFKDRKGQELPHFVNVDSFEVYNDVKDSIPKDISSNFRSISAGGIEISVSEMDDLKDNLEQKDGSNELIVEGLPDEGETNILQTKAMVDLNKKSEEFGSLSDFPEVEMEQRCIIQSPEEPIPNNFCENPSSISSVTHAAEVFSIVNPAVTSMDAKVGQATDTRVMDDTGNYEEVRTGRLEVPDNEDKKRTTVESCVENVIASSESPSAVAEIEVNAKTNLHGGDFAPHHEEGKTEKYKLSSIETGEGDTVSGSIEEKSSVETKTTPESASDLHESLGCENVIDETEGQTECPHLGSFLDHFREESRNELEEHDNNKVQDVCAGQASPAAQSEHAADVEPESHMVSKDVIDMPQMTPAETERTHPDEVLDTQKGRSELGTDGNDKVKVECVVSTAAELDKDGKAEVLSQSTENQKPEEPLTTFDASSFVQNSAVVGDNHSRDSVGAASGDKSRSLPDEGDNSIVAQLRCASATDLSVDSISQTDSLEGHWGSVSVLSTQSDIPLFVDAETLPSNGLQASAADLKKPRVAPEGKSSDKSDIFEPPSFMTLVEPRAGEGGADQNATVPETQDAQANAASVQAGWFPSITHVINESQGRKRNEEIIAKVTNWSARKQHTPLKNLLGDASTGTKSKPPIPPAVRKDEKTSIGDDTMVATVSSIPRPEIPVPVEPAKKDSGKEWDSPARYPADISREKRKVKGRPYWAQFVCCSSVN